MSVVPNVTKSPRLSHNLSPRTRLFAPTVGGESFALRGQPVDVIALEDFPPILTVKEVARIIRRSESGTYAWLKGGGLKHIRIEGSIRVLRADLETFLSARSEEGGTGFAYGDSARPPVRRSERSEG